MKYGNWCFVVACFTTHNTTCNPFPDLDTVRITTLSDTVTVGAIKLCRKLSLKLMQCEDMVIVGQDGMCTL